jgi:ABC-type sugar transport system substrate-binding protein
VNPPFNHCGLDDVAVGAALAEAAADALNGEGTLAVLRGPLTDPEYEARCLSFQSTLREQRGLHVLRELHCEGGPPQVRASIRSFCERFPSVGAVVCLDDRALRRAYTLSEPIVPPGCHLVSVHPTPDRWPLLARGWCTALVGGDYDAIASQALQWCLVVSKDGELGNVDHSVPIRVVTAENLKEWVDRWERWLAYDRHRQADGQPADGHR